MAGDGNSLKTEELTAIINEIRDRVRARHPSGSAEGAIPLPDLMPLLHARDAAEAKVAAIGTVNPRPPGLVNALVQGAKNLIARSLDWHVREQVEFNRAVMGAVQAILEALNENNRALAALAARTSELLEVRDIRDHWAEWRVEWERKLAANEAQFLRSVAELQAGFQHRVTMMDANLRELVGTQHSDFTLALERSALEIQKRLWADLEKMRAEFEKLISEELRLIRQRSLRAPVAVAPPAAMQPAPAQAGPQLDFFRFAERFRGSEEYVREKQKFYVPRFEGCRAVLDVGCGRGEFLELMKGAGVPARGIDLSEESVALCREKGLEAETADLFVYLESLPDRSLDGVFSAQVIEHLPPARVPDLVRLAAAKLARGGLLAIETPNPESLAIFATHFYLDPTHERPVPPALLVFYLEEAGFGQIRVERLSPAVDSMPSLRSLPEDFREAFFGSLDYAVFARRL